MKRKDDKSGLWNESFGAIVATIKALEDGGITAQGLARLRSDKGLAALIAEMIEREVAAERGGWSAVITVDYSKTINEQLLAMDCAWKHRNVQDYYFPIPLSLKGVKLRKEAKLFRFFDGPSMTENYELATIFELLAFCKQEKYSSAFTIVAAGSELQGIGEVIPVVSTVSGRLRLDLRSRSDVAVIGNYFLGVKK